MRSRLNVPLPPTLDNCLGHIPIILTDGPVRPRHSVDCTAATSL